MPIPSRSPQDSVAKFINMLRKEANNEEEAYREYMVLASDAGRFGYGRTALRIKSIAQDELGHRKQLLTIADALEAQGKK